ncbi:MAG: hypothetical protein CVU48_01345 [Candidatus Cloacimonetes bacterium HGW-Cloacimonetes-1]|nr:MAG: hypothetical protein CVU48_01345 [Candidatus Cloacimonetes bacterium HGW-Cloacimonetes-1]
MKIIEKIINEFLKSCCGEWNGLQIFLIPTTLFYLLDGFSVARWVSGILTLQIQFFPLVIFVATMFVVLFAIGKQYTFYIKPELSISPKVRRDLMYEFVFGIHKVIFIVLMAFMIGYVLSSFLRYFYSVQMVTRNTYAVAVHVLCVFMVFYQYTMNLWLSHFLKRGYQPNRAKAYLEVYMRRNKVAFIRYTLSMIIVMSFSVYLYRILIIQLIAPAIELLFVATNVSLKFSVIPVSSSFGHISNVCVILMAFIVANLLFAPIMNLLATLMKRLHPLEDANLGRANA